MAGESKPRYNARFRTGDAHCVSRETASSLHRFDCLVACQSFSLPMRRPPLFLGCPLFSWRTPRVSSRGWPLWKPLKRGQEVRLAMEANRGRRSWGCPFLLAICRLRRIMRPAGIGPCEVGSHQRRRAVDRCAKVPVGTNGCCRQVHIDSSAHGRRSDAGGPRPCGRMAGGRFTNTARMRTYHAEFISTRTLRSDRDNALFFVSDRQRRLHGAVGAVVVCAGGATVAGSASFGAPTKRA